MLVVLIAVFSIAILVTINVMYGDVGTDIIQPIPDILSEDMGFLEKQTSLLGILWPVMLVCVLVSLAATYLFGIMVSHRMAGPMYRIKMTLGEMAKGDLRGDVRLREKDNFKSVAEGLNHLKKAWRAPIQELKKIGEALECKDDPKQRVLLDRLLEILASFKTE
jgi:nitrogen fixation/metabolism regulation signal transduction histidine kinase